MAIATLENVGLRYGKGPEVLSDINLTLPDASLTVLVGASGSGKTSLIRLLALDVLPGRGRLTLLGRDVQQSKRSVRAELRRGIGVVWQDFRLLPTLNVFDNVALPLVVAGAKYAKIQSAVSETLRWVGLYDDREKSPVLLAGGQQQRLAIARAVIARPKLLIADEPTGNLDKANGQKILLLLRELNRLGTAVVIASHDPDVQAFFPTARVLTLNAGQVV